MDLGIKDAAHSLSVIPTGANRVGATPTVTAATYAANKCIGGIITLANILPANFSGLLESVSLKFAASVQTQVMYVALFTASPAGTFTNGNTAAIAAADMSLLTWIGTLQSPVSVLGTHTIYNLTGINHVLNGSSQNLYAVVVPGGTTAALASTTDFHISVGVV